LKVLRTVGDAVGRAEVAIASAVVDLPNVIGSEDVCRESFGRFCEAGCDRDCDIVEGTKTDGEAGRSYECTTILGEMVARLKAQSDSRNTCGLVGVKG
jgi:hypothetical protein